MKTIFCIALLFCLSACSYQGAYEGLKTSARFECRKVPPSEYDECIEQSDTSYDEYERARKEALKGDKS